MAYPETTYESLVSLDDLTGLSAEEALRHIGQLTDLSRDICKIQGLKQAIKLSRELQRRSLSAGQLATSHYFLANAWANLRTLSRAGSDRSWDWEQKEAEKEIIHLRKALHQEGLRALPDERACQILTNLGNVMDYVGRFVEAVEYWDRALAKLPSFSMARGNRGYGLTYYARSLYDKRHAAVFLRQAYADLKKALSAALQREARTGFDRCRLWIESALPREYLDKDLDMQASPMGSSKPEIRYRRWCLQNRLFLNPLNDLGPYPVSACDLLTTPDITAGAAESTYYRGYFSQMKQEFVSARYLYYEGIKAQKAHFSDQENLLDDSRDCTSYSLAVEKVKSAFRTAYSLFDKIAYFLNHYLALSIPETKVTFRTFWYASQRKNEGLRPDLQQCQNWPLRGLFWLSKDLYEDKPGFTESLEPDARELSEIRNHLEHKYLKLHHDPGPGPASENARTSLGPRNTLFFSTHRREFEAKTLRLIKMARAALIYLSLAIHWEEQRDTK